MTRKLKQGLIQVYTGEGKGKTTAAIGQIIRAIGQGLKVCLIQFFKNPDRFPYGEWKYLSKIHKLKYISFVCDHPSHNKKISKAALRQKCLNAVNQIKKMFKENVFDLIVLDELCITIRDGILKTEEVINLLKKKPKNIELIITGRSAPKKLIKCADLVTEMQKIKHPYDKGIKARRGIEF